MYSVYDILVSAQTTQILLWPRPFLKTESGSQSHSRTFRTFICQDWQYFLGALLRKCAQLQFLYFCHICSIPPPHQTVPRDSYLHTITSNLHKFYANCFYPLKFTSLTIDGQNLPLKTIPTLSLVQSILIINEVCPCQLGAHLKPSKLSSYSEES